MTDKDNIGVVVARLDALHEDVNELKTTMRESVKEVALAVHTLVRMEERQTMLVQNNENLKEDVKRLEETIKTQDTKMTSFDQRLDTLEKEQPMQKQIQKWIISAITGIVVLVGTFVAKMLGLG